MHCSYESRIPKIKTYFMIVTCGDNITARFSGLVDYKESGIGPNYRMNECRVVICFIVPCKSHRNFSLKR